MRSAWFLVGILVFSGVARAQTTAPASSDSSKAKDLFEEGKKYYRIGDYDEAIEQWKKAYLLKDEPSFLFNIAMAYKEKGDYASAIRFYQSYLKDAPDASNRDAVEQRIADLQKLADQQKSTTTTPTPTQPTQPPQPPLDNTPKPKPVTVTPPPPQPKPPQPAQPAQPKPAITPVATTEEPHHSRGLLYAGIGTGTVGVALLVVGIAEGLGAQADQKDVNAAVKNHAPWTSSLASEDSAGRSKSTVAAISFAVGAAAVVGGGVLVVLGTKKHPEEPRAVLVPAIGPRDASVTLDVRF